MLAAIVCGPPGSDCTANATLEHLSASVDAFSQKALNILNSDFDDESQHFGAFCARVVLENAFAALVGRLDPFRLLYLKSFQEQPGFQYGKAANSGFRWTGDVMPEDKGPQDLWGNDHSSSKVSRSLLSSYCEHVYWRPAIESVLDFASNVDDSVLTEIKQIDPENFVPTYRGRVSSLYSTLSKGVHWEFFVTSVIMDEGTIKDSIRETLISVGMISLASHFIPTAYRSLDPEGAIEAYVSLRSTFE
jgi:hypothetical protein